MKLQLVLLFLVLFLVQLASSASDVTSELVGKKAQTFKKFNRPGARAFRVMNGGTGRAGRAGRPRVQRGMGVGSHGNGGFKRTTRHEINERKQKEKVEREIAKRLAREHEEEDKKRSKGAAIAPPTMLIEDEIPPAPQTDEPTQSVLMPPPSFLPAFGKATSRGLGIAANIMKKHGYKEGQGLGKSEQGMSTALQIEKTGVRGGTIVAEAPKAPTFATNSMEAVQNATKVLQLWNLIDVSEVSTDETKKEFEDEIREEMEKCGQVANVLVHVDESQEEEGRRVRVFVEFTNNAQSIKAFVMMNGRFFGGRSVSAGFQNVDNYHSRQF
ncbi:unnamed protein product [Caenorhabditis sp. 36 PRJEB53466]|nr:unnamed protein product [Caenorhabditis sp. 36 PRJEB53466]